MDILKKLISGGAKEIISSANNLIDTLSTSDEEKAKAKEQLTFVVMNALNKLSELQASVLKVELSGNWLQRSWRPIVMLSFAFIVVYAYFIEPAFLVSDPNQLISNKIDERFWSLLEIGLGGYVVGRSVEKVANTVTQNIDVSFLKKKDRKVS